MCRGGGVQVGRIPVQGRPTIVSTHHPRGTNLPRGTPLGLVAYGVWGLVFQAPVCGSPTIVGGLPPPIPRGQIPPSPRRRNSRPSLTMIPISPLLCAQVRVVTARGALQPLPLTPYSPPSSPAELSIWFVEIRLFLSSSSSLFLLRSKYQRFVPRTTNFPLPNQKIGFVSCFACPI